MKVDVLFFASVREIVGCRKIEMEIPEGTSVEDLRHRLVAVYPALSRMHRSVAWAVNAEYVDESQLLRPGDEIALIPPVSGG